MQGCQSNTRRILPVPAVGLQSSRTQQVMVSRQTCPWVPELHRYQQWTCYDPMKRCWRRLHGLISRRRLADDAVLADLADVEVNCHRAGDIYESMNDPTTMSLLYGERENVKLGDFPFPRANVGLAQIRSAVAKLHARLITLLGSQWLKSLATHPKLTLYDGLLFSAKQRMLVITPCRQRCHSQLRGDGCRIFLADKGTDNLVAKR